MDARVETRYNRMCFGLNNSYAGITRFRFIGYDLSHCVAPLCRMQMYKKISSVQPNNRSIKIWNLSFRAKQHTTFLLWLKKYSA